MWPGAAATASATARVPASNGGTSKAPIGPFQKTVPARPIRLAKLAVVLAPTSRPIQPSGTSTPFSSLVSVPGVELSAEHEVLRQLEDRVALLGLGQHTLRRLDALLLDQRVAGVAALGLEEAEAHRAADQDLLGEAQEAVDHAELVGHLGAAQDDDQRSLRIVADRA